MKVIGITGTIGSGKEEVKAALIRKLSAYHVTLSDVIRAEFERKKLAFTRMMLQDQGNTMRQKYGTHILAMLAVEYLPRDKELIIVDGIRNPGEAEWLKKKFGRDFLLIAVDAPREVRFDRVIKRDSKTDTKSMEEFIKADDRDQGTGEPLYGQQVKACIDLADFQISNEGDLQQLDAVVNEVVAQIKALH
jgi:dephospho-CoA kinase